MAMDITPSNEVHGEFGLKRARGLHLKDLLWAASAAILVWLAGETLCAQWLARRLAYQPALGEPLLWFRDIPVFGFWALSRWRDAMSTSQSAEALLRSLSTFEQFVIAFAFLAGAGVIGRSRRRNNNRADSVHGSARWATLKDIVRAGLFAAQGVIVGAWEDPVARKCVWLRHDGPEHVLMYAPTGSGKGVGIVIPTLLTWLHSAIILDPKGENFALTSGYRASIGHNVYKLDFAAPEGETARFNPLDAVRLGSFQEVADVQRIARMLADPDGAASASSNKHWSDNAAALLAGAILHILYRAKSQGGRATLAHVIQELTHPAKSHVEVLREWLTYPHDPRAAQGWVDADGVITMTHPLVASAARAQLNREQAERSGVASSAITPLQIFLDPVLAANTACSDFTIDDLMDAERPTSVYLIVPSDDHQRLRPIVRLLFDLWIRRLVAKMEFVAGRPAKTHRHKLLLMLDEFPTLGRMDIIRESLAYIRGWGIKAVLVCQDSVQLRECYGRDESITSNCHLRLAFAPNHPDTAKALSELTGASTAIRQAHQRSTAFGRFTSQRSSESENEIARPLLTPDECMRLAKAQVVGTQIVTPGEMLIFAAGSPPIYGRQPLYFTDPILRARAAMPAAQVGFDRAKTPAPRPLRNAPTPTTAALGDDVERVQHSTTDIADTDHPFDETSAHHEGATGSLLLDPEFAAMAALGLEEES